MRFCSATIEIIISIFLSLVFVPYSTIDFLDKSIKGILIQDKQKFIFSENPIVSVVIPLYKQNPDDPLNTYASSIYLKDEKEFKEKVTASLNEFATINEFENLKKQNIKTIEECDCFDCQIGGILSRRIH